ncbi:MAG: hypothetical protein DWQ05_05365 [Calditrichaeota bacterium]|nr:MAG: hypothetical protein DWQ05_05365 [Calditrichota bacterium]
MKSFPKKILVAIVILLISGLPANGQTKEVKIGIALSGGGAKGFAHIGVLKVLDEAGIPIDFISGTSMGGLVGAFYSIGYSPAEIEELVTTLDWQSVLTDQIPRSLLPMAEKEKFDRYLGSFELKKGTISLPTGIIKGQNISTLLAEMTWRANAITDFSELPIPFVAVATDIASGRSVPLKSGNLATVLRATMAIPSLMTPQVLQGKLLVDGGITRNLPAQDVKDLGANYIIGVDVGTALRTIEELTTFIDIMDQSIRLGSYLQTIEQRDKCDLVIAPDMSNLAFSDFNSAAELIKRGEEAAKKKLPELLAYLEKNLTEEKLTSEQRQKILKNQSSKIDSMILEGASHRSSEIVEQELGLKFPNYISARTMTHAINRVYSSQAYHKITYEIEAENSEKWLRIQLQEKDPKLLRYGFHYNSRDAAKFLFNTTIRNITGPNSVFSLDLQLASRTQFDAEYYFAPRWANHLGLRLQAYHHSTIYDIYNGDNRTAQFGSQVQGADIFLGSLFSKKLMTGAGYNLEFVDIEREIGNPVYQETFSRIARLSYLLQFDSQNKTAFPRRGVHFKSKTELAIKQIGSENEFWRTSLDLKTFVPITKKVTGLFRLQAGFTTSDSLPLPHQFYLGGYDSFYGFKAQELAGTNLQALTFGLQLEVLRDKFITAQVNSGNVFDTWKIDTDIDRYFSGFSLGLGAATPFGPLEITLETSRRHALLTHICIGYRF